VLTTELLLFAGLPTAITIALLAGVLLRLPVKRVRCGNADGGGNAAGKGNAAGTEHGGRSEHAFTTLRQAGALDTHAVICSVDTPAPLSSGAAFSALRHFDETLLSMAVPSACLPR